jgi:uncharacterized protein YneF (UPF0154 family)
MTSQCGVRPSLTVRYAMLVPLCLLPAITLGFFLASRAAK